MTKSKTDLLSTGVNAALLFYVVYHLVIWSFWGALLFIAWLMFA